MANKTGVRLTTDNDGRPFRCAGAGLIDADEDIFEACESQPTNARMLVYEGWCLWLPLCAAHLDLFDEDVACDLEDVQGVPSA